jgi:hypothetical protein
MVGQEFVPTAYRCYGPYEWLKRRVHSYSAEHLYYTRLGWYEGRVADRKLYNIYPNELPVEYTDNSGLSVRHRDWYHYDGHLINSGIREVISPDWRTNFDEAASIAEARTPEIRETAFMVIEIKSRYPVGHSGFMSPGSWALVEEDNRISPRMVVVGGWEDPRRWGVDQTSNWCWRDEWDYQVYYDQTIGLPPSYEPSTNPDGSSTQRPVMQTVYRIDHFVFAGVNVGEEAGVTNPYAGFDPGGDDAPAPMNLDPQRLKHEDEMARMNYLSVLAVVRRPDTPQAWPSRFRGGRPTPNLYAMAQARVFNNHSWDLWTQMWHSELEPVSHYEDWTAAVVAGEAPQGVSEMELQALEKYMTATRDLAATMLTH